MFVCNIFNMLVLLQSYILTNLKEINLLSYFTV